MTEKKKMSVADILAAAREADAGQSGSAPPPSGSAAAPSEPAPPAAAEAAPEAAPASEAPTAPAAKPAAKPAPGKKLSVAEMMAAARAEKAGGGAPAEAKPAAPKPAPKPAAEKPAVEKPAAKKEPVAAASEGVKDTRSILAAARKSAAPGPITKAEAAAKASPVDKAPAAKGPVEVPPMPAKPAYAQKKPAAKAAAADEDRRTLLGAMVGSFLGLGFTTLSVTAGLWGLLTARFMFPNILTEPPSQFKVGFPSDFSPGQVETKFVAQFGVWVVNTEYQGKREIFALRTVCTHLGCTPNWLEGEQKFKCPCHGSGFYKDGINFEGPAPRPLERYAIRLADDGQVEIDKSKLYQEELGQWANPECFIPA